MGLLGDWYYNSRVLQVLAYHQVQQLQCMTLGHSRGHTQGGGGGVLSFFSYVGSGAASTVHPQKH